MKIVSYFSLNEKIETILKTMGEYVSFVGKEVLLEDICDAEILIGNIPPHLLKHCFNLKYVQLVFAGSDGYTDVVSENYVICNASGTFGVSIAEHLLMYTLMFFRNMPTYTINQQNHAYNRIDKNRLIYGSTFVICGCGDIGSEFAKRLKSLGAKTIGIKRRACSSLPYFDEVYTEDKLEDVLKEADVVALCLPKNSSTDLFLNKQRISLLKKDAIVLNVGRGNAIETSALIDALNNETIAGAGLDVFDQEPLCKEDPLYTCKNVIITPHVSGTYANAHTFDLFYALLEENLNNYRNGKTLKNGIDAISGYRKEVIVE